MPLPDGLDEAKWSRAMLMARLSSKAYDDVGKADLASETAAKAESKFEFMRTVNKVCRQTPGYVVVQAYGGTNDLIDILFSNTGLDYTVFENKAKKEWVMAFRGTEPTSIVDWITDANAIFGFADGFTNVFNQYKVAIEAAKKTLKHLLPDGFTLTFTGHSLGGGLACACALATGCDAFCFDAAGLTARVLHVLKMTHKEAEAKCGNIYQFQVEDDMVDLLNQEARHWGYNAMQYGRWFCVENINDMIPSGWLDYIPFVGDDFRKAVNSVVNHSLNVCIYQMEKRKFCTRDPTKHGRRPTSKL